MQSQARKQRRQTDRTGILNNRKMTKGRKKPHRVLERMAYLPYLFTQR